MLKTNMMKMNWKVLLTRWIIAGSLLLALLIKSIDAKAAVTESRFSELATLPATTGVAQSSTPDYIAQAQAGVKKYYPQYENFFKGIFSSINKWSYEEYIINKEIRRSLTVSWELLKSDKEIVTMILVSLEKIGCNNDSFRNQIWIIEESDINNLSNDIYKAFYRKYIKFGKNIKAFEAEFENIKKIMVNDWAEKAWTEYITISEKYMPLLKEWLLDYGNLKKSKDLQGWIETYMLMLKNTNKKPSEIGQKYIDEYNKIKKQ